jgi:hypothetical protein
MYTYRVDEEDSERELEELVPEATFTKLYHCVKTVSGTSDALDTLHMDPAWCRTNWAAIREDEGPRVN